MADAKLIIKPPHMQVRMKPGAWPDVARMLQTIRDAGYRPFDDGVALTVSGRLVRAGQGLALELDRMRTPRTLALAAAKEDPETLAHLERHVGETVEIEGAWRPAAEGGAEALAVTAIHRTGDAKPEPR